MWIHKVIIFLCLCIGSKQILETENDRFERAATGNDPDLLLVYYDLSILSRIINAISLQTSAIQKTTKIRDVITELLEVNSTSFSEVMKNNLTHFLPVLKDLEERSKSVSKSISDSDRKSVAIAVEANKDLESIKNINAFVSTDISDLEPFFDFIQLPETRKAVIVCNLEIVKTTKSFFDLLKRNTINSLHEDANIKTISDMKESSSDLKTCMNNFKNYKKEVGNVFEEKYAPLGQLQVARKGIADLGDNPEILKSYEPAIEAVKRIALKVENAMKGRKSSKVGAIFEKGVKYLKSISDPKETSPRSLTVGFQNVEDLKKVQNDLKSEWFKKRIAMGKNVEIMDKNLQEFFKFGEMMMTLEQSWLKFQKLFEKSQIHLKTTAEKVNEAEHHSKVSESYFSEYKQIFSNCKKDIKYDKRKYADYDNAYLVWSRINGKMNKIDQFIKKTVSLIDPDPLNHFLDLLRVLKTSDTVNEEIQNIKSLDGYETFYKFCDRFEDFGKLQEDILSLLDDKTIKTVRSKVPDFIKLFEKSSFLNISGCLNENNFDGNLMRTTLEYISSVLNVDHFQLTRELVDLFLEVQNGLIAVENHFKDLGAKSNSSLDNPVFKLEKSKELALSLGRGVNMLHSMGNALKYQKLLLDATKYNNEVVDSIRKSNPNSVVKKFWIDPSKPISKLLNDLKNLNKFAQSVKNQDLLKLKDVFQKAKKVDGLPEIFSYVHVQLTSYHFKDPEKVQNTQNAKELSEMDLDFSAHKGYLPAASLSIGTIKTYFDDIFGLNAKTLKTKKKTRQNAYGLVVGVSIAVFFIIVLIGLIAYGFTESGRKKYKKLYLYYFPKKDEFERRWRYSLFMDRVDGKNGLLDAVREINAPNVLKAVKKGAYINAYTNHGNTALHVATKRGYPEIVEILIRHGADRTLLNVQNKTPEQTIPPNYRETHEKKIERFKKVEMIYKKYQKKKFRVQVPDLFPNSSFHIYVEGRTDDTLTNSFSEKFQSITSDEILPTTTHCIVKTEKGGHLETDDMKLLMWIFMGVIVMKDAWMIECLKDENKINKDFDFLVKNVKYNGIMYNTVLQWTNAMAKGTIPYLHGVHVAVVIMGYQNIAVLSSIVTAQGGVMLDKFPEKEEYNVGSRPYLHAETPPLFIIHDGTVNLDVYKNDPDKMYSLFTEQEFLAFMLKRDIKVNKNRNPIPVPTDPTIE